MKNIKRTVITAMAVISILAFSACGKRQNEPDRLNVSKWNEKKPTVSAMDIQIIYNILLFLY